MSDPDTNALGSVLIEAIGLVRKGIWKVRQNPNKRLAEMQWNGKTIHVSVVSRARVRTKL